MKIAQRRKRSSERSTFVAGWETHEIIFVGWESPMIVMLAKKKKR